MCEIDAGTHTTCDGGAEAVRAPNDDLTVVCAGKIPSQLSSIKVNFVSCLPKVMTHLAAAGFFGGCLFSALRYSLVAWFFSVIALFQGITGIKALPALLDFSRKVSLRREKA